MKKNLFGIAFDPKMQPGWETRTKSLDSFMGVRINASKPEANHIFGEKDLRAKFKSHTAAQTLPSQFLRPRGKV